MRRFIDLEFVIVTLTITGLVWGVRRLATDALVFGEIDLVVVGTFAFIWAIQYAQALSKAWEEIAKCQEALVLAAEKVYSLEMQSRFYERLPGAWSWTSSYLHALKGYLTGALKLGDLLQANGRVLEVIQDLQRKGVVPDDILSTFLEYHASVTEAQTQLIYQKKLRLPGRSYFFLLATAALILALVVLNADRSATAELTVLAYAFAISSALLILVDADGPFEEARFASLRVARIAVDFEILERYAQEIERSAQ